MKCSLCGSNIENGMCTFCGMQCTQEAQEETFDKKAVLKGMQEQVELNVRTQERKPPTVYEEHYERRHIHGEGGGSLTVTSLMIKMVIMIILSIIAYMVILSRPADEGMIDDAPEIRQEESSYLVWAEKEVM